MDPQITVALIAAAGLVLATWLGQRTTHRRVKEIQSEFSTNHGTSMKDALNRIEGSQQHMLGRFDQHLQDSSEDKQAAHEEQIRMWAAIEAVAKSNPPKEIEHEQGS